MREAYPAPSIRGRMSYDRALKWGSRSVSGRNQGETTTMGDRKRRLLWHGMFLFLLGLLTGLVEQRFQNVRMGLAAHLEGVMNGVFLVALGAVWPDVMLSPRLKIAAYWCALCGTYGNWMVTTVAAILGTAALSPITAAGHSAQPWQEGFVTLGFMAVGLTIIGCSVLVLWGFRRTAAS